MEEQKGKTSRRCNFGMCQKLEVLESHGHRVNTYTDSLACLNFLVRKTPELHVGGTCVTACRNRRNLSLSRDGERWCVNLLNRMNNAAHDMARYASRRRTGTIPVGGGGGVTTGYELRIFFVHFNIPHCSSIHALSLDKQSYFRSSLLAIFSRCRPMKMTIDGSQ